MIRLRRGAAIVLLCLPTVLECQAQPALTEGLGAKIWVGRYQEIEEYLRTAECVSMEVFTSSLISRCTLRPGGPVARMAWKALPPGVHRGFTESYKAEIAAYELDKLVKLDMVPPSVERRIQGNTGAAQLWVENVVDGMDPAPPPEADRARWEGQLVRMTMFSTLIGDRDRNRRNMLRDRAWNLILVDFSRGFMAGTDLIPKLNRIDEGFWARIEGLTLEELDRALGAWLDESQIKALVDRRERMRAEIKSLPREAHPLLR